MPQNETRKWEADGWYASTNAFKDPLLRSPTSPGTLPLPSGTGGSGAAQYRDESGEATPFGHERDRGPWWRVGFRLGWVTRRALSEGPEGKLRSCFHVTDRET